MEIRQLRYFYQVYQDRSTSRAAQHLMVSQQAVSRLIRNLEEELGVELFTRSNTGVKPTKYGDYLANEAKRILENLDNVEYTLQKEHNSISGSVSIVYLIGHIAPDGRLDPKAVSGFRDIYPQIDISWHSASPRQCEELVMAGEADFALSVFPTNAGLFNCQKLFDFEWSIIMRPEHPLSDRDFIVVEDLAGEKIVMPKDEQHDRQQIMRALPSDKQPIIIDPGNSIFDLIYKNVLDENALMICAKPHAMLFSPYLVKQVPFHTNLLRNQIYILTKKGSIITPAVMLARDYLLNKWGFNSNQ